MVYFSFLWGNLQAQKTFLRKDGRFPEKGGNVIFFML